MTKRFPAAPALAALALVLSGLAAACAAYRHQHAPAAAPAGAAPAPPPAKPASAGFNALTLEQQLAEVRGEVQATKRRLREAGKYQCCVMPACNQCLLAYGECHCREQVEKEGPCCGECTEAWLEGRGMVEGIDPWELLERKKRQEMEKREGEGGEPPGGGSGGHPHHHGG
jgi:hypothetical protein